MPLHIFIILPTYFQFPPVCFLLLGKVTFLQNCKYIMHKYTPSLFSHHISNTTIVPKPVMIILCFKYFKKISISLCIFIKNDHTGLAWHVFEDTIISSPPPSSSHITKPTTRLRHHNNHPLTSSHSPNCSKEKIVKNCLIFCDVMSLYSNFKFCFAL